MVNNEHPPTPPARPQPSELRKGDTKLNNIKNNCKKRVQVSKMSLHKSKG